MRYAIDRIKTVPDRMDLIESGRKAAATRSWADAYESLSEADAAGPLSAGDLELLSTAAYMVGRDPELVRALERAHRQYLEDGEVLRAVRAAFWIGINLALRGQWEPASGWLGRAHRLLGGHEGDSAEAGYLKLPTVIEAVMAGDHATAYQTAGEAIEIGQRFSEPDLSALGVFEQGRARILGGDVPEGLQLLDEAMVAVLADELSPIVTGIVYCGVIEACHSVHALRRAHRWTDALTEWCDHQPGIVAFTGQCLTHRAELLQLRGDWAAALIEARAAGGRFPDGMNQFPAAQAHYRQGELLRLQGDLAGAAESYRMASRWGWSPQPGMSLLRLAEGDLPGAAASIGSALAEVDRPIERARVLPAAVTIQLAVGDVDAAQTAADELSGIADRHATDTLAAIAAGARGQVLLAQERPDEALAAFGKARTLWSRLDAPYETAVARMGVARACRLLGDDATASLESSQAVTAFGRLGAQPDAEAAQEWASGRPPRPSPLTAREQEVLSLVAEGRTNREVAAELVLSERTVDRHVSNILTKLGVTSRTAATAYAYEHHLL